MDLRLALYALSARHNLSAQEAMRLAELAQMQSPIELHERQAVIGVAVLAAALGGFGLIVWLAANWDTFGRFGRFALLEGLIIVMSMGAILRPVWRVPLGLGALLCTGGLFAYFGQTYQSGADPWLLFAVWATLSLPLCLSARSDVVWTPWVLVAMTAITLWAHAHTQYSWREERLDIGVHLMAWSLSLGLCTALNPRFRRWTGSGTWAWRLVLTLAVMALTKTALDDLFGIQNSVLYFLGALLLGIVAWVLAKNRTWDVFGLSVVIFCLNVLLDFGLSRALGRGGYLLGSLFLLGIFAAGLLALSVVLLMRGHRQRAAFQEVQS